MSLAELLHETDAPLRLGIIGMSEGNGHPFSWAAIINGYDAEAMQACPFPDIPQYLSKRAYPEEFISGATVTHVWTQDARLSQQIAAASRIATVAARIEDMIGQVDAVLLARDDAPNHAALAEPFLRADIPVYFDKPLALDRASALKLKEMATGERGLFSCTALRYADEFQVTPDQRRALGEIRFIDAWVPKYWDTYAVHVIEPVLANFPDLGEVAEHSTSRFGDFTQLTIRWQSGCITRFTSTGDARSPIGYRVCGTQGLAEFTFRDSFSAFRSALMHFIALVKGEKSNIPFVETLKVVDVIELGRRPR